MPISERVPGSATLPDKAIAMDLLKDCKFCVTTIAKAATAASNPEVRQFLRESLGQVIQEQFRISDMVISRGWYHPNDPNRQLQEDFHMVQLLNCQLSSQQGEVE